MRIAHSFEAATPPSLFPAHENALQPFSQRDQIGEHLIKNGKPPRNKAPDKDARLTALLRDSSDLLDLGIREAQCWLPPDGVTVLPTPPLARTAPGNSGRFWTARSSHRPLQSGPSGSRLRAGSPRPLDRPCIPGTGRPSLLPARPSAPFSGECNHCRPLEGQEIFYRHKEIPSLQKQPYDLETKLGHHQVSLSPWPVANMLLNQGSVWAQLGILVQLKS